MKKKDKSYKKSLEKSKTTLINWKRRFSRFKSTMISRLANTSSIFTELMKIISNNCSRSTSTTLRCKIKELRVQKYRDTMNELRLLKIEG